MKNKKIENFMIKLYDEHKYIEYNSSYSDFLLDDSINLPKHKKINYMLSQISKILQTELYSQNIFIDINSIKDHIYSVCYSFPKNQFYSEICKLANKFKKISKGCIIFPLHDIGIKKHDFKSRSIIKLKDFSANIYDQTNSIELSIKQTLNFMKKNISKTKANINDLRNLAHFKNIEWFKKNPLLIFKFNTYNSEMLGNKYAHEFNLIIHIKILLSFILLLFISQKNNKSKLYKLTSATLNNYEISDIKHYLLFSESWHIIPLHNKFLHALTSFPLVQLNHIFSKTASKRLYKYLYILEQNVIKKTPIYQQIFSSLNFFRKSFLSFSEDGDKIISLSTAFETLLSDHYEFNHYKRLGKKIQRLLNYRSRKITEQLFEIRGKYIHTGNIPTSFKNQDLINIARIYKKLFIKILDILQTTSITNKTKVDDILNIK